MRFSVTAPIDSILEEIVSRFEAEFPGRVCSYYVLGSYADGTALASSDLDMAVVFRETFLSETERTRAARLLPATIDAVEIDLDVTDEASLIEQVDPGFKFSSRLVFGEEIREQLPLMSIDVWTRDRMNTSYWRLVKLFDRPCRIELPVGYPDAKSEFYGYVRRTGVLADGTEVLTTRDLVRAVGWSATSIIAFRAGRFASKKAEFAKIYRETIDDQWSGLLDEIYTRCKFAWNYRIPEDRSHLRSICNGVLEFENHFLSIYREYLLSELQTKDPTIIKDTLWLLNEIPFQDNQVVAALAAVRQ